MRDITETDRHSPVHCYRVIVLYRLRTEHQEKATPERLEIMEKYRERDRISPSVCVPSTEYRVSY